MSQVIICGSRADDMVCPFCNGDNRGKHRMDECDLCGGEGTLGLFSGFFRALDRVDGQAPKEGR